MRDAKAKREIQKYIRRTGSAYKAAKRLRVTASYLSRLVSDEGRSPSVDLALAIRKDAGELGLELSAAVLVFGGDL